MRLFKLVRIASGAADGIPNAFGFASQSDVAVSTSTVSNTITISGINTSVSVTSSNGCTFSINGGAFGSSGVISTGQTLQARITSAGGWTTSVSGTVTIGGVVGSFSVTTMAQPVATYLNFLHTANAQTGTVQGYIAGDSIVSTLNTSTLVEACCGGVGIPQDGNWWYWEATCDHDGYITMAAQTAANQGAGTVAYPLTIFPLATYRGIAMRWYNSRWYCVRVSPAGAMFVAISLGTTYIAGYPAVVTRMLGTTTILLRGSQHQFTPNIAAYNTGAVYQAPCYPLLP